MDYIVATGVPTGRKFGDVGYCKNARVKECYQDPVLAANAGQTPCTDADIDNIINNINGTCNYTCDTGSTASFSYYRVTRVLPIASASTNNALNMANWILITEMEIYEDLFEIRGNTFYTRTYGRSLAWATVAIYGYLYDANLGQEYWIVRFAFGVRFGVNAYVRVAKNINCGGIETPGNQFYFSME